MGGRIEKLLASRRAVYLAVGIAVALSLPTVPKGFYLDDLVHRAQFLEVGPLTDGSNMTHRMFDFLSGDPEEIHAYKDLGVLPWWTDDELRIRFWRPLSSFTHVVDYALWPDSPALMHAQSVVWLAILVYALGLLYRRLVAVPVAAGLAAILYALDDARGMPVAFLANRNAIVAAAFGVLALLAHDRYRRDGFKPGAVLGPMAFLAALLAGESGLGVAPYLLGYALFVERGSIASRAVTLAPYGALGLAWLVAYGAGGYGTFASGFYLDPMSQTSEWLRAFPARASLLLLGQWFVPPSSFAFAWTAGLTAALAVFGLFVLLVVLRLLLPILRTDRFARCFAFGMVLAVVPITAGFPHDRLLFFVGVGASPLLALLLVRLRASSGTVLSKLAFWALVGVHVVLAPALHLMMGAGVAAQEPIYASPPRSLPNDPALETQRLVVVNPPNAFYAQYSLLVPRFDGRSAPARLLMLAPGISPLTISRPSTQTLVVTAENGWIRSPFDVVYRSPARPVPADYSIDLSGVGVRVEALTEDGHPRRVRFEFEQLLEDDSLRFVRYDDGCYRPFELPRVGESVSLDAVEFSLFAPPTGC